MEKYDRTYTIELECETDTLIHIFEKQLKRECGVEFYEIFPRSVEEELINFMDQVEDQDDTKS